MGSTRQVSRLRHTYLHCIRCNIVEVCVSYRNRFPEIRERQFINPTRQGK